MERNVRIVPLLDSSTMLQSEIFDTKKVAPFLESKIRCGTRTFFDLAGFNCGKECSHIEEIRFSDHGKNVLDPFLRFASTPIPKS